MSSKETSGMFSLGRLLPLPSLYGEHKTAQTVDVLEVGWIVGFFVLYISLLIFVPAKECKEKTCYIIRTTLIMFLGLIIMGCNFGQEWEVGTVRSHMFYKAGSKEEINATVGVKIGLRSVNVTLKALDPPAGDLVNETIDYNERFQWTWDQGRAGFGPFAGRVQRDFRAAQMRGIPYPILWVAEYFTFDGEGLRFGRRYRHAGWYSHICIWTAFPIWILTIIMLKMVIRYGAVLLSLLGCLLITSALIWSSVRNYTELKIIFNDKSNGVLVTHFGVHWYLALIVGILCLITGIVVLILDMWFHPQLCKVFGVNPFAVIDEIYEDVEETNDEAVQLKKDGNVELPKRLSRTKSKVVYRARGTNHTWKTNAIGDSRAYIDRQHERQQLKQLKTNEKETQQNHQQPFEGHSNIAYQHSSPQSTPTVRNEQSLQEPIAEEVVEGYSNTSFHEDPNYINMQPDDDPSQLSSVQVHGDNTYDEQDTTVHVPPPRPPKIF